MTRFSLSGKTVAITGGTGGFARALAPALVARGARVALLDLDGQLAQATADRLGPAPTARGWQADVTDLNGMTDVMREVTDHFGGLDVVLANAGLGEVSVLLSEADPAIWDRTVEVNLSGVYRTFRAAFPHILATRGYMLATSSMAAFIHGPLQGAYTATKAGVWALCDTWRLEVRHTGVAVGSLHPTFFATPMMDAVQADPAGRRLWDGNEKGLWKMVDIDIVVAETIRGIERRAAHITAPRTLRLAALAPGLAQWYVDRFGFRRRTVEEAVALIPPAEGATAPR